MKINCLRINTKFVLPILLLAGLAFADGDDPPELPWRIPISQWPHEYWKATRWAREDAVQSSIDDLFETFEDIGIFSVPIKVRSLSDGSVGLHAGRKIYDNNDVRGTWTVVDTFEIRASLPIFAIQPTMPEGFSFGFSIGGSGGLRFSDARQVSPRDYANLPDLEDRIRDIGNSPVYRQLQQNSKSPQVPADLPMPVGDDVLIFNPNPSLDAERNRGVRSRLLNVFNIGSFPFRFPFKAYELKDVRNLEIMTIGGTGSVYLSSSLGFGRIYSAGVGFTAGLTGNFRISILKETPRYVQVKLTRDSSDSQSLSFSTRLNESEILNGFFILENEIDIPSLGIVPFSLTVSRSDLNQFDVAYRYDLETEEGRRAYEDAVKGRFVLSENHAKDSGDRAVQRVFGQKLRTHSKSLSMASEIQVLFHFSGSSSRSVTEAQVRIGDDIHQVFRATKSANRNWNWWDWAKEEHGAQISVEVDETLAARNDPGAVRFLVEHSLTDSHTLGIELNHYQEELTQSLGLPKFFEHAPERSPSGRNIYYGRSVFQYGLSLNQAQLEKIWNLDLASVRDAVKKAWGYTDAGPTRKFVNQFLKIREEKKLRDRLRIWLSLFKRPMKKMGHFRLARLLTEKAFPNEAAVIDKYYYANNMFFGSSRLKTRDPTPVEDRLARASRESSRDQPLTFVPDSYQTILKEFRIKVPDKGPPEIHLDSAFEPMTIAVRLEQTDALNSYNELVFLVAKNRLSPDSNQGPFRIPAAPTQWEISGVSNSEIGRILASKIKRGRFYTLSLSLSRDGIQYGPAQRERFFVPKKERVARKEE